MLRSFRSRYAAAATKTKTAFAALITTWPNYFSEEYEQCLKREHEPTTAVGFFPTQQQ